jgi:hypothetical protein
MNTRSAVRVPLLLACIALFGLGGEAAFARGPAGGRMVVGHVGVGHSFGGYGSYRSFPGYAYRPSYGWRGGFAGGLGVGLFVASLPYYYSTRWWDGVPYYYADNVYYRYNDGVRQYEKVSPPSGLQQQAGSPSVTELYAYPKNGQSEEQQSKDKYDCHAWARTQSGFDPTDSAAAQSGSGNRDEYLRAQTACLEGRGYSVK